MTQFERRAQRFTDSRFSPPVSLFSQPRQLKHDLSELLRQKHRLQYFSTKENPERLLRICSFCRGAETGHFKHCCCCFQAFSARLCRSLGFQFSFFLFYFVDSSSCVTFSFSLPVFVFFFLSFLLVSCVLSLFLLPVLHPAFRINGMQLLISKVFCFSCLPVMFLDPVV